jgi:putative FmdB family regulatory protein
MPTMVSKELTCIDRSFQRDAQQSCASWTASRSDASALLGSADTVPIYEYVCMECESHFEELVRNGEQPDCPDCSSANVRKQLSVFAAHGIAEQPTPGGPSSGGGCCGGSCGCG